MYERVHTLATLLKNEINESPETVVLSALQIVAYIRKQAGIVDQFSYSGAIATMYYRFGSTVWFSNPKNHELDSADYTPAGALDCDIDWTHAVALIERLANAISDTDEAEELKGFCANIGIHDDLNFGELLIKQIVFYESMSGQRAMITMALLAAYSYSDGPEHVMYYRGEEESNTFVAVAESVKDAIFFEDRGADLIEESIDNASMLDIDIDHNLLKDVAGIAEGLLDQYIESEEF